MTSNPAADAAAVTGPDLDDTCADVAANAYQGFDLAGKQA